MKSGQRRWTREEVILVMELYCKLPFGRMHSRNPEVIELAGLVGRTPGAVAYKLVNLASFDSSLQERGIKGASNAAKLDREVWEEFSHNWEGLFLESERLRGGYGLSAEDLSAVDAPYGHAEGKVRESTVMVRVNQSLFRRIILASYNSTCCITGLSVPELLVAGHIKPWALDSHNRMNPRNGLAMNGLHDRAFEQGLVSISPDYRILIAGRLKKQPGNVVQEYFLKYEGKEIILPSKFLPDPEFLKYHNDERFKA